MKNGDASSVDAVAGRLDRYACIPDLLIPVAQWSPFFGDREYAALSGYISRQGQIVSNWCLDQIRRYLGFYTNWSYESCQVAAWVDLISWQQEDNIQGATREDREREVYLFVIQFDDAFSAFSGRIQSCRQKADTHGGVG